MDNPVTTIPSLVRRFMESKVHDDFSMGEWLYLHLSGAMQKAAEHYSNECHDLLDRIADKTGDKKIGTLSLGDGSLERDYKLVAKHLNGNDDVKMLVTRLGNAIKSYMDAIDGQIFLTEDLLPVLKDLGTGRPPRKYDLDVIREARNEDPTKAPKFMAYMRQDFIAPGTCPRHNTDNVLDEFFNDLEIMVEKSLSFSKRNSISPGNIPASIYKRMI